MTDPGARVGIDETDGAAAPVPPEPRSPFDLTLDELRSRRSAKWTAFDPDVVPMPVAEMDVRLAAPVAAALHAAVERSDTGYSGDDTGARAAMRDFSLDRWGWSVDPGLVRTAPDVGAGVIETLRVLTKPGDEVVFMPPVYPQFFVWTRAVDVRPRLVPLLDPDAGGRLDLAGIEDALRAGARVVLLCHPHNPTGRVHGRDELVALADLAARFDAVVLSDEIHAPLTLPGQEFAPYLTVSEAARDNGIAFVSASKAWNLAGLKCAFLVAGSSRSWAVLERIRGEFSWGRGHFGVLAAEAAYRDGRPWLDEVLDDLAARHRQVREDVARLLPGVTVAPAEASFLAWLDCRALDLPVEPAAYFLEHARVALMNGPDFGPGGTGRVRLNVGTSARTLRDAIAAMAAALP